MSAKTYAVPDDELLDDLRPARFLQVSDFTDRWKVAQLTVTISRIAREETVPVPSDIDPATRKPCIVIEPVLYFLDKHGKEFPRGLLLSARVNIQSLKSATGAKTHGEAKGKRIIVELGEHKHNAVLRINPTPPTA